MSVTAEGFEVREEVKDLDGVPTFCTLLGIKSSNSLFQIASVDCHSFRLLLIS